MSNLTRLLSVLVKLALSVGFSRLQVAAVVISSAAAGAASTGLLALINSQLRHPGAFSTAEGWAFAALCVLLPVTRFLSPYFLSHMTQAISRDLRLILARQVLAAPLREIEQLGPSRLLATLTDDIATITNSFGSLPNVCLNLAVAATGLIYLGYLSWRLLLMVLVFVTFGMITYRVPMRRSLEHHLKARQFRDEIFEQLRGLTSGTKELQMHRPRREAFFARKLLPTSEALRLHNIAGSTIAAAAGSWGQVLFFLVIAILLFVVPRFQSVDSHAATGFTLVILYLLTPLTVIFNLLPEMGRTLVAADRIESLGRKLAAGIHPAPSRAPAGFETWRRLELVRVEHTYYNEEKDDSFTLGPIDLEIRSGEMVFLTGGNGSGKTTLAKLIMGLYPPQAGEVRLDGQPVGDDARDTFRQLFSVVFADFFLFDTLLGLSERGLDDLARRYLERLHLARKVRVTEGGLSTLDLSQGQRKRLALLTAYLEDRPIYLFDEWAADQDPLFKEIFYRQLLPELKQLGKTVLVISHDDHYYGVAERIVKLESGRVAFDGPVESYLHGLAEAPISLPPTARVEGR